MEQEELFRRLAVALAIGLLVGLERGWQTREDPDHQRAAGLRTFALTGLLGGISAAISAATGPIVLVAALLGAYAMIGNDLVAVAVAVVMAILLALRDPLHSWVKKLTWPELRSALMLLAMTFLMLPVLPDRPIDPWNVLNPAEIWLLAILIAVISFAGYIAVRVFGDRNGIAVAALAGGLASSTAVTLSFARLAREHPESTRLLAGGILLAGATMLARILVLAGLIKPELLGTLLLPAVAAGAVQLAGSGLLLWKGESQSTQQSLLDIRSPFDLGTVLKLAGLIAVIMVVAKAMTDRASSAGLYLLAAVSGIADVDALTLSMARFAGGQVTLLDASVAIMIAAAVNTLSKTAMATAVGGRDLGLLVGGFSAASLAALAIAFLALG